MVKFILYALASPILLVGIVLDFILWTFFSTGQYRVKKKRNNALFLAQEQVAYLVHQNREMQHAHQSQITDLQRKHEEELRRLKGHKN